MRQSLNLKNARIKLRLQHLRELDRLTNIQKEVLKLIKEETTQRLFSLRDDKRACIDLRRSQSTRLIKLVISQRMEREEMITRHRQELTLLEQAEEKPEQTSN